MHGHPDGESSARIRERVSQANALQQDRQGKVNCLLDSAELDRHCPLAPAAVGLMQQAMQRLDLSARAYHRILRVARTIADLADSPTIEAPHAAEAIQYRRLSLG